jgi:hypothetical protein
MNLQNSEEELNLGGLTQSPRTHNLYELGWKLCDEKMMMIILTWNVC